MTCMKGMSIFKSDSGGPQTHRPCGIIGKLERLNEKALQLIKERITIHNASWDYEGNEPRHGTRVTALAEKPYFDEKAPTRRQALGIAGPDE